MDPSVARLQALENGKPLPPTRVGCFVRSTSNDFGPGKIIAADPATVEIEYFDSIGPDGRMRATVPRVTVRRVRIPCQTRCWFEKDGVWQVGRVIELLDSRYSIFLPTQKLELLSEADFFVRWDRPVRDPIDVLIANGFDTPLFHELRRNFMNEIVHQRAACQGMAAIFSSVVDLHPHQVDVVSRVLIDDRQRYLLADEVGLGKTIEAGMLIRQRLLDNPEARVVVAVPRFLVSQWRSELAIKFCVMDFGDKAVQVIPHSDLASLVEQRSIAMLVIDEAHLLMPASQADAFRDQTYSTLQVLAARSSGLLLLSATPLLHNEATFLAMLHLLEPDVYDLNDFDGFRARVRDRQALALRINGLTPTTPDFLARRHAEYLSTAFPTDQVVAAQVGVLLDQPVDGSSADRASAIRILRDHVRDTYRLNRRVLRNRRGAERTRGFNVRGRAGVTRLVAAETIRISVNDWLEEWRLQVVSDHGVGAESARLLLTMLECSGSDLRVLEAALIRRLDMPNDGAKAFLTPDDGKELQVLSVSSVERVLLERGLHMLSTADPSESRLSQVVDLLGDRPGSEKAVVFTGYPGLADELVRAIGEAYGSHSVAGHLGNLSSSDVESEVERFRSTHACQFLVCDSSAEAGRNFQWADRLVHVDLPWAPNRIEQRIGRLDRYGAGDPVASFALFDGSPGSFSDAWLDCLSDGFQVFSRSVASLQHPIESAMDELARSVLSGGVNRLAEAAKTLPERLQRERLDIESLESLESISEEGEFSRNLHMKIARVDNLWRDRERAAEDWISEKPGTLRFNRQLEGGGVRRYLAYPPGRRPRAENLPLIPWNVLRRIFAPLLDRPGSYSRAVATSHPGTRVLGVGDAFIDALAEYSRWDTRGQAFGMWRCRRAWRDQPEFVAFRLDFVARADIAPARALVDRDENLLRGRALERLCDLFLPPMIHTVWLDINGLAVTDDFILKALVAPYDQRLGDSHLSARRRWALDSLIPGDWRTTCEAARLAGERLASSALDLRHAAETAAARAESAFNLVLHRRQMRRSSAQVEAVSEELTWLDQAVAAALVQGLREPHLVPDAVGCVVLAGYVPEGWHDL